MTEKEKFAKQRNWQKARLVSFGSLNLGISVMTEDEKMLLKTMNDLKDALLSTWDDNSELLGMTIKRYDLYYKEYLWKQYIPYSKVNHLTKHMEKSEYELKRVK